MREEESSFPNLRQTPAETGALPVPLCEARALPGGHNHYQVIQIEKHSNVFPA